MFRIVSRARRLQLPRGLMRRPFRSSVPLLAVQTNPEIYVGYNPERKLEEVDVYAATSTNQPPVPSEYQLYGHKQFPFKETFLSTPENIHQVREGGYVAVTDEEMAKYLPDAVMGDVQPEFDYSGLKAWMIRDSTKLLCRVIEEYESNKNVVKPPANGEGTSEHGQQCVSVRATLEGLTDRPERTDAVLKVYRRGELISGAGRPSVGNFDIMSGPGSLVENVIDEIKKGNQWYEPELPTQILVTGERGTGKSITLNQTVMYARKRDWLVMVVDGWRQAHYGWFIEPYKFQAPGTERIFDNAFMSAELLRSFYRAHKDTLSTIPIENAGEVLSKYQPDLDRFREEWDRNAPLAPSGAKFIEIRRMVEGQDNFEEEDARDQDILSDFAYPKIETKTLADLVLLGLFYRDFAGAVAMDLIDQLKNLESHRVLFVVDGYNTWEVPSVYQFEGSKVMPKQLCVPRALNFLSRHRADMQQWKVKNGLAIGFTSLKHPPQLKETYADSMRSFQMVIKMPVYSSAEYLAAMRLYLDNSGLFEADITTQELIAFRMMCCSNPRLARLESMGYLVNFSGLRDAIKENPYDDSEMDDFGEGAGEGKSARGARKGDRGLEDEFGDDDFDYDLDKDDSVLADDVILDEDVKF